MRVNLSVAIVAMTDPSINPDFPTYDWSVSTRSNILSSFFWGYFIPQVAAGLLAEKYGPKWFLVATMALSSISAFLIPLMTHYSPWYVIVCRIVDGFCQGFFYPCIQYLLSKWVPVNERSRMGAFVYAGGPLGTVIAMPVTGWISASCMGWPSAFYLYAILGVLWMIGWILWGSNDASQHKTISESERMYIQKSTGHSSEDKKYSTPWKHMFTSLPVWALIVGYSGQYWGYSTMMTQIPTYMNGVLRFDIQSNGLLSAAPYLTLWLTSFFFSFMADFLFNRKMLSMTNTRKLATAIGLIGPAIALLTLGLIGEPNRGEAIGLLILAVGINSAIYSGTEVNHIDISPRFAATLMGITNGLGNVFSLIAPLIVQYIVTDETNATEWRIVFFIAAESWFGVRHIQVALLFGILVVGHGMRVNLSVGIVAMTDPTINPDFPSYDWSVSTRSNVLSGFFWGYFIPQIAAGLLAEKYGPKWFLVVTMALSSISAFLVPTMAEQGPWYVIVCRIVDGFCQGFFYPCIQYLLSKWVPVNERSRMGAFVYAGGPLGTVIALPVTGWISASSIGWPSAFYLYGILGVLWIIGWILWGSNDASQHKTISESERKYIEASTGHSSDDKKYPTPWKHMLTSLPVWALIAGYSGQYWGYSTMMTQIPTYMNGVLRFDIQSNGLLSAAPYLTLWLASFFFSFMADFLFNRKILSMTNTRKLATAIGLIGPGIALLILGLIGEPDRGQAIGLLILAVGINSAIYSGTEVNHIDISPRFAATLMGITNGLGNVFSLIAPLIVQYIVTDETNASEWRIVFFIAAGVYVGCDIFYSIFGKAETQDWDTPATKNALT
ncbi:solute carrier family 17 [Holotrichia oblita]|uniref:Solute carrier family 17 n=1 Tax=Holotrichia oblita TaxID=644536 RepID=A0ACB9SMT7_HOLOL|nr:solute carrier family 17 [Holotrichia oblita]